MIKENNYIITEEAMDEVTSSIGTPILELSDLGLDHSKVIKIAFIPAMRLYFSYYPILRKMEVPVTGQIEVPFPVEENTYIDTFGVTQARVALMQNSTSFGKNPFINEIIRKQSTAYGSYGLQPQTGRDPYIFTKTRIYEQAETQSYLNLSKAGNFNIDYEEKKLWGYSNVQGNLVITFAQRSRDWRLIRMEHETDVISVTQAYLLRWLGQVRAAMDPNTGVSMNYDVMLSRADSIEDNIVTQKWKSRIPMVVLK